jgi:Suppressor of fused protein (SUFU)
MEMVVILSYALWKDTEANSFLFTNGSELIPAAQIGQKKIEFIQLVPLYASELQFKKLKGEDALWEVFEEKGVPYWSSIRGPEF